MMLALWTAVTFLRPNFFAYSNAKYRNSSACFLCDDFQGFDDAGNDFMFEAGIQTLGVLTDDDEIDVAESRLHSGQITHWPKIGIQVENLARRTFTLSKPPPIGVATGPFSAIPLRRTDSTTSSGREEPARS